MITISERWRELYPGAALGVLQLKTNTNPDDDPTLEARRLVAEDNLRQRFSQADRSTLLGLPVLQAYTSYYKRFKKTYHVLLQVESVALKGRPIPGGPGLVQAMFVAELENMLLTAGHDMQAVEPPLELDAARGDETYIGMSGQEQTLKPGDMYIADQQGILSSVLGGPDARTRITTATRRALFTVYAPPGIQESAVLQHLDSIFEIVQLFDRQAEVDALLLLK